MGDQTATVPYSQQTLDFDAIRSRISELRAISSYSDDASELSPSDSEKSLTDYARELQSKIDQLLLDAYDVGSLPLEDLDEYLEHLKGELNRVETENAKISDEIEDLYRKYLEDSNKLESDLDGLDCQLDCLASQGPNKAKEDEYTNGEDQMQVLHAHEDSNFESLKLSHQIEKNKMTLKSLQDLDCIYKRLKAVEKIEDTLTGLKIIEFEGNHIRLSLRACITKLDGSLCQQKFEGIIEPLELDHELLIELVDGTMELKNVEIFPNDVYIGEIIDAAKSFSGASRQLFSPLPVPETRSSLEWFVRRVHDRIILCTLRQIFVKCANKSRHSIEYFDRDDTIVARMVGGVEAFIKLSQGWPLSNSALKLISLKSSSQYSKEISLSFLCKVEEVANSLDAHIRQNISSFVDAIEEILKQRTRAENPV